MPKDIWNQFGDNKLCHSVARYLMMIKALLFRQGYTRLAVVAKRCNIRWGSCCNGLKLMTKCRIVADDQNKIPQLSGVGELVDWGPVRAFRKDIRSLFTSCTHGFGNFPTCNTACYLKAEQVDTE